MSPRIIGNVEWILRREVYVADDMKTISTICTLAPNENNYIIPHLPAYPHEKKPVRLKYRGMD